MTMKYPPQIFESPRRQAGRRFGGFIILRIAGNLNTDGTLDDRDYPYGAVDPYKYLP